MLSVPEMMAMLGLVACLQEAASLYGIKPKGWFYMRAVEGQVL